MCFFTPGISLLRVDCTAECREIARVNCSGSSARDDAAGRDGEMARSDLKATRGVEFAER